MTRRKELLNLLQGDDIIVAPGAANAITAKLIEEAGFKTAYITGAGLSNSTLGVADVGLLSFKEVLDQVKYICDATTVPIIADGDTGFGNAINLIRTVKEYEKAGVCAIQLEDQDFPKKCGHFSGKRVVEKDEMVNKIKAAVDARVNEDFLIIARTDVRAIHGMDEAIERAQAYVEAGADITFVEAPQDQAELARIPQELKVPQVANMVEHGLTPLTSNEELQGMGFKIVLYANLLQRAAIKSMQEVLQHLHQNGSSEGVLDRIITMKERNRVTGLDQIKEWEEKYLKI